MDATPTTRAPLSRITRTLAVVVVIFAVLAVALPVAAQAAASHVTATGTSKANCGGEARGSGQMDGAGWTYVLCDNPNWSISQPASVQVFDAGGVLQFMVPLSVQAADVAPSPDASALYVTEYPSRIVRRYTGSKAAKAYTRDAAWKLQNLPAGNMLVRGEYVATDAAGDLYVSSGIWKDSADRKDQWAERTGLVASTIVKYRPDGTYVTNFGSVASGAVADSKDRATMEQAWAKGVAYDDWAGLVVTANGKRVFAADKLNNRIHRFDSTNGTTYAASTAFGNSSAFATWYFDKDLQKWKWDRAETCFQPGRLAAPYDLTMSAAGELLVINTTCYYMGGIPSWDPQPVGTVEVQRFGQDGSSRGVIEAMSYGGAKVHGIAVDRIGTIHMPQGNVRVKAPAGYSDAGADIGGGGPLGGTAQPGSIGEPAGPIPGAPDTAAPIIESVTAPQGGTSLTVPLTIVARDDRGIADIHVYEDQVALGWKNYSSTYQHEVVGGIGAHWVSIQVRDAAGNLSNPMGLWVKVVAPPVIVTPDPKPAAPAPTPDAPKNGNAPSANAPKNGGNGVVPAAPGPRTTDSKVANASSPVITAVKLPPSTTTGKVTAKLTARDPEGGALFVRVAGENGRWGKLQKIGKIAVPLSRGAGWKGAYFQVVDAQGNRSRVWFQPVLSAPKVTSWKRGSLVADKLKGTSRADHIDLSRFDATVDRVSCGAGIDTVLLQPEDIAAKDCERVVRLKTPAS